MIDAGAATSAEKIEGPCDQTGKSAWASAPHDPTKVMAVGYVWLSVVGFVHLMGSGMAFDLNVIDLASASDFLVAGFRDPFVTVLAVASGFWLYRLWLVAALDRRRWRALVLTSHLTTLGWMGAFLPSPRCCRCRILEGSLGFAAPDDGVR